MTNEQILDLIGANPDIRTVQISDRLDCDIGELQEMLQDLMQRGFIVSHQVIGPNKHKATAYSLSMKFVPFGKDASVPPAAQSADAASTGKTKVDQAIEFIAARGKDGSATSAELHTLLKLKSHEYASSYLAPPLNDGRLVKDGKTWTLGDGTPRARGMVAPKPPFEAPTPAVTIPVFTKGPFKAQVPSAAQAAPAPGPIVVVTANTPLANATAELRLDPEPQSLAAPSGPISGFSCALWSHGELQLVRGGTEIAKLTPDESRQLLEYLGRIVEDVEVTP